MPIHLIDYLFWWSNPVLMTAIAVYMLRGRLQREFPYFFTFVVFGVVSFAIEFPVHSWVNYFYVYWTLTAVNNLLGFAVLLELLQKITAGIPALRRWNVSLLGWGAIAITAMITAWPHGSDVIDNVTNGVYLTSRVCRWAQLALGFYVVTLGSAVGISRRSLVYGIAAGLGLWAGVNLAVFATVSQHAGFVSKVTLARSNSLAYLVCMLIWLAYVARAADGTTEAVT